MQIISCEKQLKCQSSSAGVGRRGFPCFILLLGFFSCHTSHCEYFVQTSNLNSWSIYGNMYHRNRWYFALYMPCKGQSWMFRGLPLIQCTPVKWSSFTGHVHYIRHCVLCWKGDKRLTNVLTTPKQPFMCLVTPRTRLARLLSSLLSTGSCCCWGDGATWFFPSLLWMSIETVPYIQCANICITNACAGFRKELTDCHCPEHWHYNDCSNITWLLNFFLTLLLP